MKISAGIGIKTGNVLIALRVKAQGSLQSPPLRSNNLPSMITGTKRRTPNSGRAYAGSAEVWGRNTHRPQTMHVPYANVAE